MDHINSTLLLSDGPAIVAGHLGLHTSAKSDVTIAAPSISNGLVSVAGFHPRFGDLGLSLESIMILIPDPWLVTASWFGLGSSHLHQFYFHLGFSIVRSAKGPAMLILLVFIA